MTHIFFVVKSTSQETNGARQNRLDGRQKWLEPTIGTFRSTSSRLPKSTPGLHIGLAIIRLDFWIRLAYWYTCFTYLLWHFDRRYLTAHTFRLYTV